MYDRSTPGFTYRRFLRGEEHQNHYIYRGSFYSRCRISEDLSPDFTVYAVSRPDEQDARQFAERLALLLNQGAELDIYLAYTVVDDTPMYLASWEQDGISYGMEVSADADGVWGVGVLYEEKDGGDE
jgi:hypothetical protein